MNEVKRYPVEMGWILEPTDEQGFSRIVTEIDGEDVVLASDYDALLEDAWWLYDASDNAAQEHFYERWLQEEK